MTPLLYLSPLPGPKKTKRKFVKQFPSCTMPLDKARQGERHKRAVAVLIKALMSGPQTTRQLMEVCGFTDSATRRWVLALRGANLVRLGPYIRRKDGHMVYTYFWDPGGKDELRPPKLTRAEYDKRYSRKKAVAAERAEDAKKAVTRNATTLQDIWLFTQQGERAKSG